MALSRKAIFDALETRLATCGFVTCSQKLEMFTDVPPSEQPACFLQPGAQSASYQPGRPTVWTINADVMLYVNEDSDAGPSGTLQTCIDLIEAALEVTPAEKNGSGKYPRSDFATTLGGIVSAVRIVSVETDEGALGPQAVAVIAIEITTVA
jgi:hypothetical protein